MTSITSEPLSTTTNNSRTPLTRDELSQALEVEVYDRMGKTETLGTLIRGQRSVLIFIRHFWCLNCQAYVRCISSAIPPSKLPLNTQILIIGCGSFQPIDTYATSSSSQYPIYTDPTRRLHSILNFNSNLAVEKSGEEKRDYMRDAGSTAARIWGGIKGAMGHLEHTGYVGPKSLNGGEIVIDGNGKCEYIYRMQNTVDHTNISELAGVIGVDYTPSEGETYTQQACGDACIVEAGKSN